MQNRVEVKLGNQQILLILNKITMPTISIFIKIFFVLTKISDNWQNYYAN